MEEDVAMSKRRSYDFVLLFVLAAGLLAFAGCKKSAEEKMAENLMERAMEKASGGKADVDLAGGKVKIKDATGADEIDYGATTWPDDLPEGALKFESGKVKGVTRSTRPDGKNWMVMVENVALDSVNAYIEALQGAGYAVPTNMTTGQGGMFQAEKDKLFLIGMFNSEEKILSLSFVLRND
jgi:hypothetical protein